MQNIPCFTQEQKFSTKELKYHTSLIFTTFSNRYILCLLYNTVNDYYLYRNYFLHKNISVPITNLHIPFTVFITAGAGYHVRLRKKNRKNPYLGFMQKYSFPGSMTTLPDSTCTAYSTRTSLMFINQWKRKRIRIKRTLRQSSLPYLIIQRSEIILHLLNPGIVLIAYLLQFRKIKTPYFPFIPGFTTAHIIQTISLIYDYFLIFSAPR